MENLSDQQAVWIALSELFVDKKIEHKQIAKRVAHLPIAQIQHILFYEVAPVCMPNLLVLTPKIRQNFDEQAVITNVDKHLQNMQSDWLYRQKVLLKIRLYQLLLKRDWRKVMREIRKVNGKRD